MAKITIIIVNYNSGARLLRCLQHLGVQSRPADEIIIVDNASTDGSITKAAQSGVQFTLMEPGTNIGFAAANNRAASKARGEWLAFLNPDAYPEPDWLASFSDGAARYPTVDAFGSTQLMDADPARLDGAGDVCSVYGFYYRSGFGHLADVVREDMNCFAPCAAAAFYRKDRFMSLGGFDERFFCYGEDVDLGFRHHLAGGECVQLKAAKVRHEGSGVTGHHSAFSVYHGHRNRIWVYFKNTPPLLYFLTAPLRAFADIAFGLKAMKTGQGNAYLKALRDGYLGLHTFKADRRRWSRKENSRTIARQFVWSPLRVLTRRGK